MATWSKENIWWPAVDTTGAWDTSTHTIQFQNIDNAFSTGAVLATQGTGATHMYTPVSDLDTTKIYDVHISHLSTPIDRIYGPDTITLPAE